MAINVICNECGTKNRLGAIFCRECGAKLDMEATDQQLREREGKFTFNDFKRYFRIFQQVLALGLLALAVLVLIGLFLPAPMQPAPNFPERERKMITGRFSRVMAESRGNVREYKKEHEFSEQEVAMLANWLCGLEESDPEDVGYALSPQELSVRLLGTQYVRLVLRSKAFKKVNIYSTMIGRFVEREDGYRFVPVSGKIGKVGMPGPLKRIVIDRFKPLFLEVEQLSMLSESLESVQVFEGQIVVSVKKEGDR